MCCWKGRPNPGAPCTFGQKGSRSMSRRREFASSQKRKRDRPLCCAWMFGMLLLSGCAIEGKTQKIPITSVPQGAEVRVDSFVGHTPTVVELKRGQPHLVSLSLNGYKTEVVTIGKVI